ncbi:MAG: CoA transferase [Ilumatobacteraceae bacterium]
MATGEGRTAFAALLSDADVWIDAYRPGACAANGFDLDAVRPGSVVVQISAFDWVGPWAGRRGFDSIVQTTTGIASEGMRQAGTDVPTPLPVQALDYCTGLLAAFAARRLVDHQAGVGGTWLARLSLLRTRNWLVGLAPPQPFTPSKPTVDPAALHAVSTAWGELTAPLPLGGAWRSPPTPLGTAEPVWL